MNPEVVSWATVASPIVGAVAIIVALIISCKSSKESKKQIEAVYNLLDVFIASHNLDILEAKRQNEKQLAKLDKQIEEVNESLDLVTHPFGYTCRMDLIEEAERKKGIRQKKDAFSEQRKEVYYNLMLIQSYIDKASQSGYHWMQKRQESE